MTHSGTFLETAKIDYASEGAFFISMPAAVYRPWRQRPPEGLDTNKTVEATGHPSTHVNMGRVRPG